jgi:hypothetical protein
LRLFDGQDVLPRHVLRTGRVRGANRGLREDAAEVGGERKNADERALDR